MNLAELETNKNVSEYVFGVGALSSLPGMLSKKRINEKEFVVFIVDSYFQKEKQILSQLQINDLDKLVFVPTTIEPTTDYVDSLVRQLKSVGAVKPCAVVGIGGGTTMDVAKAISILLTNGGKSEDYQGWGLVKKPGIHKIAVPTVSGTGAEASKTCVVTNTNSGLKMGMNSEYSIYDQLILDPNLTATVPRKQYFYSGMDAYIHCVESVNGSYRNALADSHCDQTIRLCGEVFSSEDMMTMENRSKLMVASYLGGCAIGASYVGVVHPFSAGLSVVLGLHHCVANCTTMRAMEEYYPAEFKKFWTMVEKQEIEIPERVCHGLSDEQYDQLYRSTILHEKPLTNMLGKNFREILSAQKVKEIFLKM
jgi:3-deoxy-alpha-D-manno-octulosonate 8-oxidase